MKNEKIVLAQLTNRWAEMQALRGSTTPDWAQLDRVIRDVMSYVSGWADCSYAAGDRENTKLFTWLFDFVTDEIFTPHNEEVRRDEMH